MRPEHRFSVLQVIHHLGRLSGAEAHQHGIYVCIGEFGGRVPEEVLAKSRAWLVPEVSTGFVAQNNFPGRLLDKLSAPICSEFDRMCR